MKFARRILQIVALLVLTLTLIFPPYKFVWRYMLNHTEGEITGFLGYYYVFSPPDNPLLIAKAARTRLLSSGTTPPAFDHRTDSVNAEMDVGRLLLQLLGTCVIAGILTALLDKKIANNSDRSGHAPV